MISGSLDEVWLFSWEYTLQGMSQCYRRCWLTYLTYTLHCLQKIEERSISTLGAIIISFHPLEIVVAFDETVKMLNPFTVSTRVEHVAIPLEGEWKATGSDSALGSVWIFQQTPGAVYGPTIEIVIFSDDVCAERAGSKLTTAVCLELETLNQNLDEISGHLGRLAIGQNLMCDVTKRIGPVPEPGGTLETQMAHPRHLVTSLTRSDSLDDRVVLLEREILAVRELVELEPDSKCKKHNSVVCLGCFPDLATCLRYGNEHAN